MESKAQRRKKIVELSKKFPFDEKERQTDEVLNILKATPLWVSAQKIGLYMPTAIEFDLTKLFTENQEKELLIPKCLPQRQMIFAKYDPNQLVRSDFGLLEPASNLAVEPDLILVPGLIWNEQGYRIGFGGGYYDRYLSNFTGKTASVLYDFQKANFQPEAHDIPVQQLFIGEKNNEY